MWKKVIETCEVLVYETSMPKLDIRIEARKEESTREKTINEEYSNCEKSFNSERWIIYLKYVACNNINFNEEFFCKDIEETKEMINCLMESKLKTFNEVVSLKISQTQELKVDIKRTSKDYNSEGWVFRVNKEPVNNRIFIRDSDIMDVDVILYEQYKINEERIIQKLIEVLGLSNNDSRTKITIHYCKSTSKYFLEEGYLENLQNT